jgi:hypothetical protein
MELNLNAVTVVMEVNVKKTKILRAIGGTNGELTARTAPADDAYQKEPERRSKFAPWLKWVMLTVVCMAIAAIIATPQIMKINDFTEPRSAGLALDGTAESAAKYVSPDKWEGLPTENFILDEQAVTGIAVDRRGFRRLEDIAAYADVWVVVPNVHETAQDGDNMQTSIAEYSETVGDNILTRQWDDHTISTGRRVLIHQNLIGGCTMDEPNNLLRVGGVYLLPLKFNQYRGAYEVAGDLDVLFELNDESEIVSHSRFPEFSKYDGESFSELLDDVRALYPAPDTEFIEQPINSVEEAEATSLKTPR